MRPKFAGPRGCRRLLHGFPCRSCMEALPSYVLILQTYEMTPSSVQPYATLHTPQIPGSCFRVPHVERQGQGAHTSTHPVVGHAVVHTAGSVTSDHQEKCRGLTQSRMVGDRGSPGRCRESGPDWFRRYSRRSTVTVRHPGGGALGL